ncbi:NUDIX domain-containing protein, partial [Patescibacteria group bacterium]
IKDGKILLMYREKYGEKYWTFPGGGVESSEKPEDAVIRETLEETTINSKLDKLLYVDEHKTHRQYYYVCNYISGTPKVGKGSIEEEKMRTEDNYYKPQWVDLGELPNLLLHPVEIRDKLIKDLKNL